MVAEPFFDTGLADSCTKTADLRGTAYGFFNLVAGCAMLVASALAGLLWDRLGASYTFVAGGIFGTAALLAILLRSRMQSQP